MSAGLVFDIQRGSFHDGPGLRTTVFLKGCPLRCAWCHNPESQARQPELSVDPARCLGCGACVPACASGCHAVDAGRHAYERAGCSACGACATACPALALETVGRRMTVPEVLAEVRQDRAFHADSGGGLTLSGGEPLAQPAFAAALLAAARAEGLHTAIETCGWAPWDDCAAVARHCDLIICDIKAEEVRHQELTGVPLAPILANLRRLHAAGAALWLRLPLVPGCNDGPDRWREVAAICGELPGIRRVQLIPYHPLGRGKAARLGRPGAEFTAPVPDARALAAAQAALAALEVAADLPD